MDYTFIINPKSGGKNTSERLVRMIREKFSGNPEHKFEIVHTQFAGHAKEIARDAAKRKCDIVAAAGGDGTVNEVCTALVDTKSCFGLIPTGSGNGFARSLGIALKPEAAIERLLNPDRVTIDVGQINQEYFFGIAGIGFDAVIGKAFQEFGTRGPLPYFYIGIREYLNYNYERINLHYGGENLKLEPLLITIANTKQYGNGAIIAPDAEFDDGLLDVCIINKFRFFNGIRKIHTLFNGKISSANFYKSFQVSDLEIHRSEKQGLFHVDGEPIQGDAILKIRLKSKALTVCV